MVWHLKPMKLTLEQSRKLRASGVLLLSGTVLGAFYAGCIYAEGSLEVRSSPLNVSWCET